MSKQVNTTVLHMNRRAYTVENVRKNSDGSYDVLASVLISSYGGYPAWYDVMYKNVTVNSFNSVPAHLIRHEDRWESPFKSDAMLTKKGAKDLVAICEQFEQNKYWDERFFCSLTKQSNEVLERMIRERDEYRAKNFRWDLFD